MSLEIYSKDYSNFPQSLHSRQKKVKRERFFYAFITTVGLLAVLFAAGPLLLWNISTSKRLGAKVENLPVPDKEVIVQSAPSLSDIQVVEDQDGFSYFTTTNTTENGTPDTNRPKEFYITIPKLKIEKATAKVDNLNFKKNLSHFPGTSLPGEVGNTFITGHSVLPQFADPKDYNAIFTRLPTLKIGDEVFVEIDGKTLKYIVQYSKIVDPKDVSVLAPISKTGRNLTLMTCVPPGTSTKRLVVVTALI